MTKIYAPMGPEASKYLPVAKEQTCLVRQGDRYYYYSIGVSPFKYDAPEGKSLLRFASEHSQERDIIEKTFVIVLT